MSAGAIGWVFAHSTASRATFAVHLALADSANDMHDYELWARQQWIADKARVGRPKVNEALAWLTEHGYLVMVEPGQRGGERGGRPNRYRLVMDDRPRVGGPEGDVVYGDIGGGAMSSTATPDVVYGDIGDVVYGDTEPKKRYNPTSNPTSRGAASNGQSASRHPVAASPPPEAKGKKRKRRLPEDWSPAGAHASLAASLGVESEREAEQFRDHHAARGSTFVDWDAAFRTWLRNAGRFAAAPRSQRPPTHRERNEDVLRRAALGQLRPSWPIAPAGHGVIEAEAR